jgi:DnaJ-domain-containing protein 1
MKEYDELFDVAIKVIVEMSYASVSLISKRLQIDKDRASRILFQLEAAGHISSAESTQTRFVEQSAYDYVRRLTKEKQYPQSNQNGKQTINRYKKDIVAAYDILGVTPGASEQEIDEAYRKLVKMYHPDKVMSLAPEYLEIAERRMKEINVAYQEIRTKRPT